MPALSHAIPGDQSHAFIVPRGTLYLDTAAQGPRLASVQHAARDALEASVAPWRLTTEAWEAAIESVRRRAAALFEDTVDAVALVPSASYGLAIAARNLALAPGEAVLVLDGQFPSNLLPWQQRCQDVGARLVAANRKPGHDWTTAVLAAMDADPAIRVLALPHTYWHDGAVLDLDVICARAHEGGAALVLDLSQSLGALPVDFARWQPDFAVAVGHKWLLGAPGLAYLWAAPQWRERGVSIEQHWLARDAGRDWNFPSERPPRYRQGARRFDAGGVADPMRLAMADAALSQIHDWGVARIAASLQARTRAFAACLDDRGLAHWLANGPHAHFLGIRPDRDAVQMLQQALSRAGIVVTSRHGLLRIAPHLQVGVDDMRAVATLIADAAAKAVPHRI